MSDIPAVKRRRRILFLCTGNSCRSQMAEGLVNHLCPGLMEAASAGTRPQMLNPYAVRVLREIGIDIAHHRPKSVTELGEELFDLVVTVCDDAHEACPVLPASGAIIHRAFEDPPRSTLGYADEEAILAVYRRVRDEIRAFVDELAAQHLTA